MLAEPEEPSRGTVMRLHRQRTPLHAPHHTAGANYCCKNYGSRWCIRKHWRELRCGDSHNRGLGHRLLVLPQIVQVQAVEEARVLKL